MSVSSLPPTTPTTGTITSPSLGSNLDVNGIVSQLMTVASQPLTLMQQKEASYQAKISAYGSIQSALASFQTSVSALSSASAFQSFSATPSNPSVLSATASATASQGNYSITVGTLAQAQTISSAGQASTTAAIGTGTPTTLTFQFGTISGVAPVNGQYDDATFTQNPAQASGTVVINSSNNSLQGIQQAINAANIGVTASIVDDGSSTNPYHLLLTSNSSGASNSMMITSSGGDSSISNLLSYDPTASTQNLTQTEAAANATLTVNGLQITSASNTVNGAIPQVTLNLAQGGGATTNLSISNNTSSVASAVQSFVQAYNSVNTAIASQTGYDATTKTGGTLLGDFSIEMIQSQLSSAVTQQLSGLGNDTLTNLTQVGISFNKDGSMALDTSQLQTAIANNFNDFAPLFASVGTPTDSLISFAGSTADSKPGSYAVNVTSLATQGNLTGSSTATQQTLLTGSAVPGNLTISAANNDDHLLVSVDGAAAVPVALTQGTYANSAALAAQVQTDINNALTTNGQTGQVSVASNGGILSVESNTFGPTSNVSVTNDPSYPSDTGATNLLGTPANSSVVTINAGVNDQLALSADGVHATITLAPGTYSATALAAEIQSAANGAAAFSSAGVSLNVAQNAGVLSMTSSSYGSTSAVAVTGGDAATELFGSNPTSTAGTDVAGTINGVAASGYGQYLTGASGNAAAGLTLQVLGGITGARGTVNFSQGYAYNINSVLTNILSSSGVLADATNGANSSITSIQNQAAVFTAQLTTIQANYQAQYSALDTLLANMSSTSNYLTSELASLSSSSSTG